jgi:hypothetical protein
MKNGQGSRANVRTNGKVLKAASSNDQSSDGQAIAGAVRVLTDIYQLLEEYSPVWYSPNLRQRIQVALKSLEEQAPAK